MTVTMGRRKFVAALGSATVAWPLAARAQQPKVPVVGLLSGVSFEGPYAVPVAAIRQGLQETGFVEGRNLAIEYRTADGQYERLPELATDLVRRQVMVIVAIGASIPELAAKVAASTIPIVFAMGSDAVEVGVVNHLDRPQANVTGMSATAGAVSKGLELLLELRRGASLVGYLDNRFANFDLNALKTKASKIQFGGRGCCTTLQRCQWLAVANLAKCVV
jgi:putative tryptophan/tyrosine transport system substrate-binding protein